MVTDRGNNALRFVTTIGGVSTVTDNDEGGFTDGEGASVRFNRTIDIVVEGEGIIVVNPLHLRVFFPRRVWSHLIVYIKRSSFRASPPQISVLVFSSQAERPGPSSGPRDVHHGW